MKNDRLIPGLILVLVGLAFLFHTLGYIHFHWSNIFSLWPVFLIIGGVNLLFANNKTPLAMIIKVGVVIIGFALLLFGDFGNRFWMPSYTYTWHDHHDNDDNDNNSSDDDDDDDTTAAKNVVKISGVSNFNLPFSADAKTAELHISGGGTEYNLSDTTGELFKADTKEHFGTYVLSHSNSGSNYVLNFDINDKKSGHFNWHNDHDNSNAVTFKLNSNPIWDIHVDAGATELKFDLTKFKIHSLDLSGGAASFDVTLGQPVNGDTNVTVSTGMANVSISVPQNAACKITTDSGLSNNSFDGFTKTDDGDYETPGFDAAKTKIILNISGGLSDFKVHRY
jgi:hypothetical protein